MIKIEADNEGWWWWWRKDGVLHREDGPALITANSRRWYLHGKCHREDGPAIEWADGDKWWYFDGIRISCSSQQEFERIIRLKAFW